MLGILCKVSYLLSK